MAKSNQPKEPFDWYKYHGVEPPEHIPHISDEEREAKFAEIRASTKHGNWKQMGNYIWCTNCPNQHGDKIPPEYLLQGTDEKGLPILTKIT